MHQLALLIRYMLSTRNKFLKLFFRACFKLTFLFLCMLESVITGNDLVFSGEFNLDDGHDFVQQ